MKHYLRAHTSDERLKRIELVLLVSIVSWLMIGAAAAVLYFAPWSANAQNASTPQSLRVSEIVVVDPKGIERARIGGDLPDAVVDGKRVPRGEKAAGLLLYDGAGQERGGYVTFEPSSNIALTLDTKKQQVALFAAGPDSGAALNMRSGMNSIDLRSDNDGARVTLIKNGHLIQQQPEIDKMSAATCQEYKDARGKYTKERVAQSCRQRFGEKACNSCLAEN